MTYQRERTEAALISTLPATAAEHGSGGKGDRTPPDLPLAHSLRPRGPVQLRLDHHRRADAIVVTVAGELDVLTAPKFIAFIADLLRRRASDLIVDLTETEFIDSAGLQILLSAQRRVSRDGRWRAVICPEGPVRRVIDMTRLTEALAVTSSFSEYDRAR